ncbi:hypothetical protein EDE15_3994 [Edaphobacter aggregans]|uniref:Uncharacterized protein n=1 Tax=Edaphobacter aggregans TaxID=570835 RepID=A0A3R9WJ34_9BACT|nr:hypothetical protein EDE15_3994 [Edaphobacter aggregans]
MVSHSLIHERDKVTRVLEQVAPFCVKARAGLSCDNFRQRRTLFFERCNLVADLNQYVRIRSF